MQKGPGDGAWIVLLFQEFNLLIRSPENGSVQLTVPAPFQITGHALIPKENQHLGRTV
jgi:hypothetical protein